MIDRSIHCTREYCLRCADHRVSVPPDLHHVCCIRRAAACLSYQDIEELPQRLSGQEYGGGGNGTYQAGRQCLFRGLLQALRVDEYVGVECC